MKKCELEKSKLKIVTSQIVYLLTPGLGSHTCKITVTIEIIHIRNCKECIEYDCIEEVHYPKRC